MTDAHEPRPERIRVAVTPPGKTLFEGLGDKRLDVHTTPTPTDSAPDWIVFPCNRDLSFLESVADMPLKSWFSATAGRARIVMDGSGEGRPLRGHTTDRIHRLLHDIGAGPGVGVYITQDRTFRAEYLARCAADNVRPMLRVITYDYFIRRLFSVYEGGSEAIFTERLAAFEARADRRSRRFVSLNLTPRRSKVLFLLRLLRDGLWSSGYISFGGFRFPKSTDREHALVVYGAHMRKLPGFNELGWELLHLLPELDSLG